MRVPRTPGITHRIVTELTPPARIVACITCTPPPLVAQTLERVATRIAAGDANALAEVVGMERKVHPVGACQPFPHDGPMFSVGSDAMAMFLKRLFRQAADLGGVYLSLHDFHHGHLVYCRKHCRLVILFHTREYPAWDEDKFPFELGFCQNGSSVRVDAVDMTVRNVVYVVGEDVLALVHTPGREPFGTVCETEIGERVADVYLFEAKRGMRNEAVNRGLYFVLF